MPDPVALAAVGAGVAIGLSAIGSGIGVGIAGAAGAGIISERPEKFGTALVFQALPQTQAIYGLLIGILILLAVGLLGGEVKDIEKPLAFAALGAGLSVGLAGISAMGQGIAASSGIGATSEKPEVFGKGMVFSVLPETQAIYGLLVAILIMAGSGMLGGAPKEITITMGLAAVGAGLSVGLAGFSAIGQGITAAGGIGSIARRPETMGKNMVFSVMSETFAIFGLLGAVLILLGVGLLG
jgi:V/A-type H+-transporting ATPase subunit K